MANPKSFPLVRGRIEPPQVVEHPRAVVERAGTRLEAVNTE